jgi:hypothetical protein
MLLPRTSKAYTSALKEWASAGRDDRRDGESINGSRISSESGKLDDQQFEKVNFE